ncbi:MAG: 1-(5-phosphoribosyl)-5-amino-4-imidazole-carboxylate carboxylase, partial [Chloroflexi bacterium]|nr:1-(5-phosphoribosyl)-5-amino-4-imidazole-carboxylate carboxylase [Chloroflexota bacterium]
MDEATLRALLTSVHEQRLSPDEAVNALRHLPFTDLDFAKLDSHRAIRTGFPEVVLCTGKKESHVVAIMERLAAGPGPVLATRAGPELFAAVQKVVPAVRYNDLARLIIYEPQPWPKRKGVIMVITAGTSDIPVAEEAAATAEVMGNKVDRLFDVGVAGLHRLLAHVDRIMAASVLIVVAGMEG